jgi:hypothetical protein
VLTINSLRTGGRPDGTGVIVLLGLVLLGQVSVAVTGSDPNESTPEQVAYGAGSVLGTVVYAPFKATFCALGGRCRKNANRDVVAQPVITICAGTKNIPFIHISRTT